MACADIVRGDSDGCERLVDSGGCERLGDADCGGCDVSEDDARAFCDCDWCCSRTSSESDLRRTGVVAGADWGLAWDENIVCGGML